jgi:hypothetical protein
MQTCDTGANPMQFNIKLCKSVQQYFSVKHSTLLWGWIKNQQANT